MACPCINLQRRRNQPKQIIRSRRTLPRNLVPGPSDAIFFINKIILVVVKAVMPTASRPKRSEDGKRRWRRDRILQIKFRKWVLNFGIIFEREPLSLLIHSNIRTVWR